MTMETISRACGRDDDLADEAATNRLERHAVVIVGAGQNTLHMGSSLERLKQLHPLHVFEVSQPLIPVDPDKFHLVNTPEGQRSSQQLLGSGAVHAMYGSLVPPLHGAFLLNTLEHIGNGEVDFGVIAKPAVPDRATLRLVDAAKRAAEAKLRLLHGDAFDPEENPILYVHEHYKEKGAWHAFREQLCEITERLGRPVFATVDIEEARTAEQEGRVEAFGGGALEDLGPHVISLGLDVYGAMKKKREKGGRYSIADQSQTSVERVRYAGSDLPEGVETGFIVHGNTMVTDHTDGTIHDFSYTWRGGKGLIDRKEAVLVFEHPDTSERTTITIDLKNNTLDVPDSIQDLFPETKFDDNGYGHSVEVGLNGGDPRQSFQPWDEARTVTIWGDSLARQGRNNGEPRVHPQGVSLEELEQHLSIDAA